MKARNKTLLHYDAILFDVDGTLIDSAPGIIHTLQEVFCTMGVDVSGINLRRYLGPPLRKSFGEHFTDPALIEKATDLYRTSYAVKGSHECAVFPGVLQMLQTLKQAGFILCTATSKPTKVVTPILEEQGLAQYFDFIGGASMDESRDTKTEVVRYVLSQPALQGKRVLMVGDRNDDMRGAADCGLDAAGALYGLNYSSLQAAKFNFNTSILVLVFVVLGGLGNIWGSLVAAAALTILPEALREFADYRMLVYAIVLILVMLATHNPTLQSFFARLKPGKKEEKEAA